jgi:hypothetical protein
MNTPVFALARLKRKPTGFDFFVSVGNNASWKSFGSNDASQMLRFALAKWAAGLERTVHRMESGCKFFSQSSDAPPSSGSTHA